jgi:DNA (cytosine-5)-methyltransferase 1
MVKISNQVSIQKAKSTMPIITQPPPQIISLFSGAGGMDLGFQQEGFDISIAIDLEESAISTHKKNFSGSLSIAADLTEIGPKGVLTKAKFKINKGEKIGIIGGPPCQGFSRANPGSLASDPRNKLPALYLKIIAELQTYYEVEFVVFENVLGMKDEKHAAKYRSLIRGLKKLGFSVHEKELCALDFGVPQNRKRIIISALKKDKGYTKVTPIKSIGKTTVRETIGGLCEPAFFYRGIRVTEIPFHPNHWTMKPKSLRFKKTNTETNSRSFRRLKWDNPSPTIAFGNREIHLHPEGTRRLSIYEAMLLQGFPSTFVLEGNLSEQVTQISNAVPPPLARSLAAAVKNALQGK